MKKVDNVFYLDEKIQTSLSKIDEQKVDAMVSRAGDSRIVMLERNSERVMIVFKVEDNYFTYEVNGHYYGKFFYVDDKIIVRWPKRVSEEKEKKKVIEEVQSIFRETL